MKINPINLDGVKYVAVDIGETQYTTEVGAVIYMSEGDKRRTFIELFELNSVTDFDYTRDLSGKKILITVLK